MKNIFKTLVFTFLAGAFSACGGSMDAKHPARNQEAQEAASLETVSDSLTESDLEILTRSLDEMAELERAGSWLQGMAITESAIRERIGDLPGAVAAAYKELAFAYGKGVIQKQEKDQGLINLLELKSDQSVTDAANAVLAFSREQWEQAGAGLSKLFYTEEEPDSFVNWMLLVCAMEQNLKTNSSADKKVISAYRSIRARYSQFPEYWYRGARAFSILASGAIAADFAENCINSSPEGPYADECRKILAEHSGLNGENGLSIKTKKEIEILIAQSINSGDPKILDPLLPLISLPDNPYTMYAVGALSALTRIPKFREYFIAQSQISHGRLSERLLFISRS